jgi:nitric oxide reductase large subunit
MVLWLLLGWLATSCVVAPLVGLMFADRCGSERRAEQ